MNMGSLPKMEDCENFTEFEAVNYLTSVVDNLEKSKTVFDSSSIHDLIFRLSQSYFDYDSKTIEKVSEAFSDKRLIKLLCYYLMRLSDPLDMKNKTLNLLLTLLVNFTDQSQKFSVEIAKSKIPKIAIRNCLIGELICHLETKENYDFIWKCVLIIHNVARNPASRITHRCDEFKKILVELIKYKDEDKLGVASMLTLSYLVGEDDKDLLNEGTGLINNLIKKINYTVDKGTKCGGYSTYELIYGLQCIAVNDNMKMRIYEEGAIPILIGILQRNHEKEIEPSLAVIEHLCFNVDIRRKLKEEFEIENILKLFQNDKSEKVRKHYDGIIWKVNNKGESFHEKLKEVKIKSKEKDYQFDIFISYCWANKTKVMEIVNHLKEKDLRVWIDEEQLEGSSLESMARGIENSKLFIIAISSSYKSSANCRDEAEYAHAIRKPTIPLILELKYKPDSWLGFIIGSKVYYEFSERRNVNDVIRDLLRSIGEKLEKGGNGEGHRNVKGKKVNVIVVDKLSEISEKWTSNEVMEWLDKSNVGHLKDNFTTVDGSLLSVMCEIRSNSPEYFNKALENQFGMNFIDIMKFHKALNELVLI